MKTPRGEQPPRKPVRWRKFRTCLCALRVVVLLFIFLVVVAGTYLDMVGLPDFVKRPLVEKLRARGVDVEFSRLRLNWSRGLVADSVRFGPTGESGGGPRLFAREAEVKLGRDAMAWFSVVVDSLSVRGGSFSWQVAGTNEARRTLSVNDIQARLRFLPHDQWRLDNFSAAFGGGRVHLSGAVTNASAVRDWKVFHPGAGRPATPGGPTFAHERLREALDTMGRIKFATPPNLEVVFYGDARDLETFRGQATLRAPGAVTPWGTLTDGLLLARLNGRMGTNSPPEATVELLADSATTRWGDTTHFRLRAHAVPDDSSTNLVRANLVILADNLTTEWTKATNVELTVDWTRFPLTETGTGNGATNLARATLSLRTDSVATEWAQATNIQITAEWTRSLTPPSGAGGEATNLARAKLAVRADNITSDWAKAANVQFLADWSHSPTNIIPLAGTVELSLTNAGTQWASAARLQLGARFDSSPTNAAVAPDAQWGRWAVLAPYAFNWDCRLDDIRAREFQLAGLLCGGQWRAPDLTVTNVHAEMYDGRIDLDAGLNVATHTVVFEGREDFDARKIAPLLGAAGSNWLAEITWRLPPRAQVAGGLTLPAWDSPNWSGVTNLVSAFWLRGEIDAGECSFRDLGITSAKSHFSYTNLIWDLPDLVVVRPEGTVELAHRSDVGTRDFYFHVRSGIDVKIAQTLLDPETREAADQLVLSRPPEIDAEIWGRWGEGDRTGISARVALTNFSFRGESVDGFTGTVAFTNQMARVFNGRLDRAGAYATADGVLVDIKARMLYLTNGFGNLDAMVMGHMLGPVVTRDFEPYQFLRPPTVRGYGAIPLENHLPADAHFQIEGGPFRWMKFNADHVSARLNWVGEVLSLTNLDAVFYRGRALGDASFDFSIPGSGAEFRTAITIMDSDVSALLGDLSSHTNKLDGYLSGHLNFTDGDTSDPRTWIGNGDLTLRDGFIWSVPVFGIFSKMLNALKPGLGETKATQASANFIITNSVIFSKNLQILAPTMGMNYRGSVDFDENVNAIVEAKLLREAPVLGPLLSVLLAPLTKALEYKVTGTLDDPKMAQRFRVVTPLMHPINTIKDILPAEPPGTNAPPVKKGP